MKVTLLRPPAAGSFAPRWGRRGSAGTVTRARGGRASRDVLAPKKKNPARGGCAGCPSRAVFEKAAECRAPGRALTAHTMDVPERFVRMNEDTRGEPIVKGKRTEPEGRECAPRISCENARGRKKAGKQKTPKEQLIPQSKSPQQEGALRLHSGSGLALHSGSGEVPSPPQRVQARCALR